MKIKNATIKDFDTAYEYIKNSGTTTPTTMKQPKKSMKKYYKTKTVCIFCNRRRWNFSWILPWRLFSDLLDVRAYLLCIKFDHKRRRPR